MGFAQPTLRDLGRRTDFQNRYMLFIFHSLKTKNLRLRRFILFVLRKLKLAMTK
jgi:hypothetical protein